MSDNQNLPINVGSEREVGTITYANEVIAIIAGMAMNEIEGVVAAPNTGSGIADLFRSSKPATRGVKVEVGTEETSVDLVMGVEYGQPIQKVATEVQENVRKAIETMTGLKVVKVDVHVVGISFEKETQEQEAGMEKAQGIKMDDSSTMDENNIGETADIDSPPEGVDPEELPVRNVFMNDGRMDDECEDASAVMTDDKAGQGAEGV